MQKDDETRRLFASAASRSTAQRTAPHHTVLNRTNHRTDGTLTCKHTVLTTEFQRTTHRTAPVLLVRYFNFFYGAFCTFHMSNHPLISACMSLQSQARYMTNNPPHYTTETAYLSLLFPALRCPERRSPYSGVIK